MTESGTLADAISAVRGKVGQKSGRRNFYLSGDRG
jgi:hypothetical protein